MRNFTLIPVGISLQTVILLLALSSSFFTAHAQGVAINDAGTAPDASAILDLSSSSQGFLMPRMNTIDRILISNPAEGLLVYDQETNSPWLRSQSVWQELVPIPSGSLIMRTDRNDTRMSRAGFCYMGELPLANGGNIKGWLTPAPSVTGAPAAASGYISLWTGSEVLLFGGFNGAVLAGGGRYDPIGDSWTPISTVGASPNLAGSTWAENGSELFIWGGSSGLFIMSNAGYRYDWGADSWMSMSTLNAPSGRQFASSTWTGTHFFVFGGRIAQFFSSTVLGDGALYDPNTDSWTPLPTAGAPSPRFRANVYTSGTKVIVWGGTDPSGNPLYDGAIYDTQTGTWGPMNNSNAPSTLASYRMVSQGEKMLVFGSLFGNGVAGAIYDADADNWTPINTQGAPERSGYSLTWAGTEVILWSGRTGGSTYFSDGAIYRPDMDSWCGFSDMNEPTARRDHSAIWTGTELMIFGGISASNTYLQAPAILGIPTGLTYFLYRKN